uniref:uncharacterized protein LOC122610848 n=1 Tax=Erigeron canadensis TaxID=72917 RepID=UPI001CB9CE96|nr:uncharacterized protein LOC122610848 [Erigeron canadensis]
MEVDYIKTCMKKLTIWYTPNFKPIITHDELDHYMSILGFIPQPPITAATATVTVWKEYSFTGFGPFLLKSQSHHPLPRPRLPYPRIDGLHVDTYSSFLDAINFYLKMDNVSDLFHIRGMALHNIHDRRYKWSRMDKDNDKYVYRVGTLDLSDTSDNTYKEQNPVSRIVPFKNIIDRKL